ncbi:hypothetical protein LCGC14_0974110 [marine sediment metagenome]|uniref:Yip1 domain-containing protein n=1 Tax=marine sediment metagenome TaxID=412755 RepID=A0A0F9NF76_9ZZZZ
MLFQNADPLIFIIWLILATVIVTLIIYIVVILLESKTRASDKKFVIFLLAFIIVLILPVVLNAIGMVLNAIGNALAEARNALDNGGVNHVGDLVPVIGFLILLVLVKFLIDIPWDKSVWIALLVLFILYIMYSLLPELYTFLGVGF